MTGRRDCQHPRANHQHGTPNAYICDRCRCDPCRAAATAREAARRRAKAYGRYNALVDAEPVREHIRLLSASGVGLKRITALTGVSGGVLTKLVYGYPLADGTRRPPCARCTPRVRDRILSVRPGDLAAGALVDATGTRRQLQALVVNGWSQSQLAQRLGMARANFGKTMRAAHVTRTTADAVRALYERMWDAAPPESNHRERIAASRARRYAREAEWAPPLAWDDETIDDPDATSEDLARGDVHDEVLVQRIADGRHHVPLHTHRPLELIEAVRVLAGRRMSDAEIGRRVGRSRAAVLKIRIREGIPAGAVSGASQKWRAS